MYCVHIVYQDQDTSCDYMNQICITMCLRKKKGNIYGESEWVEGNG